MSQTLSTRGVKPARRLAWWTEMVCETYVQLDCDAARPGESIDGEIRAHRLATLDFSRVTSTAQRVRRTAQRIARSSEDRLLVSIQTRGEGFVTQDGRTAKLQPGEFALYDSTRPYELAFERDFQQYVLMVPGQTLRAALPAVGRMTARTVSGQRGVGPLLVDMIRSLDCNVDALKPASAHAIADSVVQILIAGLAVLPGASPVAPSRLTAWHRERIKAHVLARLRDPELNVKAIARELRTSASTVHRVWAGNGCSLSEWIWASRFEAARRDLCNPTMANRSVSEIAYSWGFNDAAHFSRGFRARFGLSPRDFRSGT